MKKYLAISLVFVVVLIAIIGVGIVLAQGQGGEGATADEIGTSSDTNGASQGDDGAGEQSNQPNQIGETDLEPAQLYNANLRVSGIVLKPRDSLVEWHHSSEGGCIYASSGDQTVWWNTGIYLPQGSTVKYLRMFVNDTNAAHNSRGFFTVYDLNGVRFDEWGVDSSGSSGNDYFTTAEFTHTVDYDKYSYVVNWQPNELGTDMQLCGFRLYYHTPPGAVALPVIMNTLTGEH